MKESDREDIARRKESTEMEEVLVCMSFSNKNVVPQQSKHSSIGNSQFLVVIVNQCNSAVHIKMENVH